MFLPCSFLLVLMLFNGGCNKSANPPVARIVVQDLHYPWEILWGPDNMIWMTERGGRISRVDPLSDYGRLRDVCVSPRGKVYICTSNGSNDKIIEISK